MPQVGARVQNKGQLCKLLFNYAIFTGVALAKAGLVVEQLRLSICLSFRLFICPQHFLDA